MRFKKYFIKPQWTFCRQLLTFILFLYELFFKNQPSKACWWPWYFRSQNKVFLQLFLPKHSGTCTQTIRMVKWKRSQTQDNAKYQSTWGKCMGDCKAGYFVHVCPFFSHRKMGGDARSSICAHTSASQIFLWIFLPSSQPLNQVALNLLFCKQNNHAVPWS